MKICVNVYPASAESSFVPLGAFLLAKKKEEKFLELTLNLRLNKEQFDIKT
jgi:hypothetical protein